MTNQKQRSIIESKMVNGLIQLGVKRSSGAFLDRLPSRGFFYGGGVWETQTNWKDSPDLRPYVAKAGDGNAYKFRLHKIVGSNPARQAPNFNFYDIPSSKRDVRGTQ